MDRLLLLLAGRRLPNAKRYGLAVLAVAAIAGLRAPVPVLCLPFLFFIPVLMGIGLVLGRGPGFLATVLSAFVAAYLFVEPAFSLTLSGRDWLATLLFILVNLGIVAVCDSLATALLRREADVAALAESRAALAESEAFLRSVLASSADCIKVLDLDACLTFMSEGGQRVMEVADFEAIRGCPWPDFWEGEGNAEARAAVAAARAGGRGHFRGAADTMAGTPRYWDVQVTPIPGPDGRPEKLLSVSRDITAVRESEAAQEVLNQEISHRLKNTLAMVLSIAAQTLSTVRDREPVRVFERRIHALSAAHDVLLRKKWASAPAGEIVRAALDNLGQGERVRVSGPEPELGPRSALSLSLLLHELITNAVKYGALSVPEGMVELSWRMTGQGGDAEVRLDWRESGGPPPVEPAVSGRKGFGSRLIGMGLVGTGGVELRYPPTGFEATMCASLAQLQRS